MPSEIEQLARQAGQQLKSANLKLATVESCTGGGLSYWITHIAGSSQWFECSFVTYSRTAKMKMVGVDAETLTQFGEVSEPTVIAMAKGGLLHSHADICIAITGIAGPDGGSKDKPIGTVWVAWARRNQGIKTMKLLIDGDRETVRTQTIEKALKGLLEMTDAQP